MEEEEKTVETTEDTKEKLKEIPRRSEEELKQLVLDFCDNKVFSSAHMSPEEQQYLGSVFMVINLGALDTLSEEALDQVGLIYEYYSEAAPRSVNGMPIFFSCRFLHKDDWEIVRNAANKELERRKNISL